MDDSRTLHNSYGWSICRIIIVVVVIIIIIIVVIIMIINNNNSNNNIEFDEIIGYISSEWLPAPT